MLDVHFGGLMWRLDPVDARAAAQVWTAYSAYDALAPTPEVVCEVASCHPLEPAMDSTLQVTRDANRCYVARSDFRGEVDLEARRVWVEYAGHIASLHAFMRVANALLLAVTDGLLLHASCIVRDGRAFLFPGPSGAGKTTIARLGEGAVLGDEVSAVRLIDGVFHGFATPFFGDYEGPGAPGVSAVLARVCFPLQARSDSFMQASSAAAVQQIVRSVYRPGADSELTLRMLDTCAALATHVPCEWSNEPVAGQTPSAPR